MVIFKKFSLLFFKCSISQRYPLTINQPVSRMAGLLGGRVLAQRTKRSAVQASTTASCCGGELFTYI